MPFLSRRAQLAPASPIRKLEPLARQAAERGLHIYHLNIGQPDVPTPAAFLRAATLPEGQVLAYSPSVGLYGFRRALAAHYSGSLGLPVTEEDVLVTTGGSEALLFAILSICDPGDEIITPEPFYPNYRMFAVMAGAEVRPLRTRIEEGFRLPPPAVFAEAVTPRTRAVLLCNPSNPTGAVYDPEALRAVVDLCRQRGLYLIADEVYREFIYGGLRPQSILAIPGATDVAIVVDSLSKRFSACGARVGCLVSRLRPVLEAATRFAMSRLSPPTLGQLGGMAVLQEAEAFIEPMIADFERRRNVLLEELRRLPGVLCPEPQGAFYLMARLPVDSSERFCQWLLTDFSLDGETVMLAPGPGFYATAGAGHDEVRIAYVLAEAPLRRAMHLLGHALGTYPGGTRG
ncbi:MAG: pyridoxal phosphate-dependent aminotransferase [Myxococcales bacterium]|nr:pyridoxal phosphate-dependent aminotransferase [Myxococcota bacterium]MDW8281962.1 pyridoxal phosphate-dependent aminotransferase [Myxococcales bacterium]